MKKGPVQIEGIVAREADVAIVLLRRSAHELQMLRWDLQTDTVIPGQWIRAKIHPRACDVTPDGRLFVAGLFDPGHRRDRPPNADPSEAWGWTAVSRPPYFTALAFWFDGEGLGGLWSSNRDLHLFPPEDGPPVKGSVPKGVRRHALRQTHQGSGSQYGERLRRDGWEESRTSFSLTLHEDWPTNEVLTRQLDAVGLHRGFLTSVGGLAPGRDAHAHVTTWTKAFPGGRIVRRLGERFETLRLEDESGQARLTMQGGWKPWAWIDLDARGRVIYGHEGGLWAWADFPDGEPERIADLNGNAFESFPAPGWARKWPA